MIALSCSRPVVNASNLRVHASAGPGHVNGLCQRRVARVRAEPERADIEDSVKADLERLRRAQEASRSRFQPSDTPKENAGRQGGPKEILDKILIADFFFILAALAALAIALGVNIATEDDTLAKLWLQLWPVLFQPAIGVLMAGALVSGGINWIREKTQN